jgi:hypothetical protein
MIVGSTNGIVTLRAGKEVDCGVEVVLRYEASLEVWTEELLCARAGVEGCLQPGEWDGDAMFGVCSGGHLVSFQRFTRTTTQTQFYSQPKTYERTPTASIQ